MVSFRVLSFCPQQVFRIVCIALCSVLVFWGCFLTFFFFASSSPVLFFGKKKIVKAIESPLAFSLGLRSDPMEFPLPSLKNIEEEMIFSIEKRHPCDPLQNLGISVRLKKTGFRSLALPARLDLRYENGLKFSDEPSSFWAELQMEGLKEIRVNVFVSMQGEEKRQVGTFVATAKEIPVVSFRELAENSPFRLLAEGKFFGHDVFLEKYGDGLRREQIEIGGTASPERFELVSGDYLVRKEEKWYKIGSFTDVTRDPLVRVVSSDGKALFFEGWDEQGYVRFALPMVQVAPSKIKAEELLTSVRIRSEKQISCMIEKQCLILKVGDWVVKKENRWKVLRKKEQRDAYLQGSILGELFMFDRIDVNGLQKVVVGCFFNADRSQMFPVEVAVGLQNKDPAGMKKGK